MWGDQGVGYLRGLHRRILHGNVWILRDLRTVSSSVYCSIALCWQCIRFVCERCEGVWPLCDVCGPQCWKYVPPHSRTSSSTHLTKYNSCSLSKWHETCTSCGDDICMSHAPNIRRVQQTCTLCEARFCDTCFFQHDHCIIEKCAVCYKMVCDVG